MTVGTRPRARGTARSAARGAAGPVYLGGAASAALRPALESARRPARVLAAFPLAVYLEVRTETEPHVVALVTGQGVRLPNAVVVAGPLDGPAAGDDGWVGDGVVEAGGLSVRVARWWDPAPSLGTADLGGLRPALARLRAVREASGRRPGLPPGGAVTLLADGCRRGSLTDGVTATELLLGLGPGLTPSGDDLLAGLLVTLRHLGRAANAPRAVWLADWLAATVTFDARVRTTPISATLLHCAARGEAAPEATGVLQAVAGRRPLEAAAHRLLALGHTSGADMLWGVEIGLSAVLSLGEGP
ncbi:DUF2877 domain-containing protein [Microbispora sp. RL4-1S]|uniref:DUF2877 domain-containing protein n=1 Tax=Microbispora oryzae TaxID=2806554 RepID=A0A940WHI4_9ACTN|nr:DUF2877 domain-containing protein [Microbispora oryzae]MBP2705680.1 DUF2877 domain-containing protein [Microbispora oryzae]